MFVFYNYISYTIIPEPQTGKFTKPSQRTSSFNQNQNNNKNNINKIKNKNNNNDLETLLEEGTGDRLFARSRSRRSQGRLIDR